jgi:MFS family permease
VPGFRWWFTSQVLSSSGLFTQNVAAAWLILQQTGNGLNLAFLTCASFAPVFLAGSWEGQLVDRFDHRRLLIATQASLLALSAALAILAFAVRELCPGPATVRIPAGTSSVTASVATRRTRLGTGCPHSFTSTDPACQILAQLGHS